MSEEEIAQAHPQIDELKTELRSRADDMQHIVYALNHDFKQLLRGISSHAQLLQRHHSEDQRSNELASFIVASATEMNSMLEALLRYSRVLSNPSRTMISLTTIAQIAALQVQNLLQQSGGELKYGWLPEVSVNESQFVQLFENLFANAIKFRGTERPIIEVTAEEGRDCYFVSVRDNGAGIDSKYHQMIFAPFKRLHGKEIPGHGLGLAICKNIVQAHGGRIWVESGEPLGSVFRFSVPF